MRTRKSVSEIYWPVEATKEESGAESGKDCCSFFGRNENKVLAFNFDIFSPLRLSIFKTFTKK